MQFTKGSIQDLQIITLKKFVDARGFFFEMFREDRYREANIPSLLQNNVSCSHQNVLRGLHHQTINTQGKLIQVLQGRVLDIVIDARPWSPTFKTIEKFHLSGDLPQQIYIPPGCLHGFVSLEDNTLFMYHCSDYYNPKGELTVAWNDSELAIDWEVNNPLLSEKDAQHNISFSAFIEKELACQPSS